MVWIAPWFISFMLVTPPLLQGVVGSYPIRDVWFPSYLMLEGAGRIHNFGL
jgi:hypothetical protein